MDNKNICLKQKYIYISTIHMYFAFMDVMESKNEKKLSVIMYKFYNLRDLK